jgi:hypothetical protein
MNALIEDANSAKQQTIILCREEIFGRPFYPQATYLILRQSQEQRKGAKWHENKNKNSKFKKTPCDTTYLVFTLQTLT